MATGFVYIVRTARNYQQPDFACVPTSFRNRLYFGPCKRRMRPKMREGDYAFRVSPSGVAQRRFLYCAQIEECITYRDAYDRFPDLRGPTGPIHVRPINGSGRFGVPHKK
jgi:hypothetical protein